MQAKNDLDADAREAKKKEADALAAEQRQMNKLQPFGADALAQSGLFARSALTLTPSFTIQQQQLDVLRTIANNTSTGNIFTK